MDNPVNHHKPLNFDKDTLRRLAAASKEDGYMCTGTFQPVEDWEDVITNKWRRARADNRIVEPKLSKDKVLNIVDLDGNEFEFKNYSLKVEKEVLIVSLGNVHPIVFLKERLKSWKERKPKKRFTQYQHVQYKRGRKVGKETLVSNLTKEQAQEGLCDLMDLVSKLQTHQAGMDWELERYGFQI